MNRVLDLFCGAGGFSCGFLDKGNSFIGIDTCTVALETYRNNIKGEIIECDALKVDFSSVGKVDILIGSPPCQPHSTANRYKDHDPSLIKRYMEALDELKPRWWVMEEVVGAVKTGLIPRQYHRYLKACDFGLPHVRKRLFAGNYPEVVKNRCIPSIKTPIAEMRGYYHGKEDKNRIIESIGMLPTITSGAGCHCAVAGDRFKLIDAAILIDGKDPTKTFGDIVTVEFCAKIMGFPGDYAFAGNKTQKYRQIGNAVCPPVARAIWEAIQYPLCNLLNYRNT